MKGACSLSKRRKLKTIEEKVQGEQEEMGSEKSTENSVLSTTGSPF